MEGERSPRGIGEKNEREERREEKTVEQGKDKGRVLHGMGVQLLSMRAHASLMVDTGNTPAGVCHASVNTPAQEAEVGVLCGAVCKAPSTAKC